MRAIDALSDWKELSLSFSLFADEQKFVGKIRWNKRGNAYFYKFYTIDRLAAVHVCVHDPELRK